MQAGDDIGGELVGRARDIEHQRVLRFLQIGELPREDGFSSEMAMPAFDMVAHFFIRSTQIADVHFEPSGKLVAITLFERRACQHNILTCGAEAHEFGVNFFKPG